MADSLVDYAQFLETVRRDYDRAEEMYKRAVEADPKYAWGLRKYAHLCDHSGIGRNFWWRGGDGTMSVYFAVQRYKKLSYPSDNRS